MTNELNELEAQLCCAVIEGNEFQIAILEQKICNWHDEHD